MNRWKNRLDGEEERERENGKGRREESGRRINELIDGCLDGRRGWIFDTWMFG